MNDINDIVFQVFNGVLDMNYNKNKKDTFKDKFNKFCRYFISGYIFEVKKNRILQNKKNFYNIYYKNKPKLKIAVYTVSTGKYDLLKSPIYVDQDIHYFAFTNGETDVPKPRKLIDISTRLKDLTNLEKARYVKTHPHEFFSEYDIAVFIDGNIRITCDIKPLIYTMLESSKTMAIHNHQSRDCIYDEANAVYAVGKARRKEIKKQINFYKNENFPRHFGLFETNVIICKMDDYRCKLVMKDWWEQISLFTKRDQLSFTYSLWKNGFSKEFVHSLGNNSRRNPFFIVDSHS